MQFARSWRLALAGCILACSMGCGDSGGGMAGGAGLGGGGGTGGVCDVDAVNACLDLQNCCRAILVNPVYFQSCNSVVLQCDEAECLELLEGYVQCRNLDL